MSWHLPRMEGARLVRRLDLLAWLWRVEVTQVARVWLKGRGGLLRTRLFLPWEVEDFLLRITAPKEVLLLAPLELSLDLSCGAGRLRL